MNQKTIYTIGGVIVAIGTLVGLYFLGKKTQVEEIKTTGGKEGEVPKDAPKDEQIGGGTIKNPSGCSPLDYTQNISSGSRAKTIANKSGNVYLLGQAIQVKDGATIFRRDANGCSVGSMKTKSRLNLGTIWHINPSGTSVVVKQNKDFTYPFYSMSIEALQ